MILATLGHLLLLLLLAPLLPGVIARVKALFAGRVGPPLLQPYFELARLCRKGSVFSETTTWVFRAGPAAGLAVPLLAAQLVPFGGLAPPISFAGDLVLFVYLFALARFFTVAAALDTGSSFEGMGGAREATFACLAEPTVLLAFLVLGRLSGTWSLGGMLGSALPQEWAAGGAALGLVVVCLFVVLLVESCRIPFDDPNTHLELTMIHEVMVLDHSGPAFGMILYGAALKLFVLGAVVVRLALPWSTGSVFGDTALFVAGMLLLAVLIGVVESVMARLRLLRIPQVLVGTTLVAALALVLVLR
jgi:formate hydrogenlyase subunit 4